jgi:cysteine synthase B
LKEKFPHITIIGVRPEIWPGIEGLKPLGSPEDIVPKIFDETVVDEWINITADDAKNWANSVARKGYFVGQSSGSYLAATSKLLEKINSGNVVTIFNDIGERYFSSGLWS